MSKSIINDSPRFRRGLYFLDISYKIWYNKDVEEKELMSMLATNYSNVRSNLKEYCDRVTDEGEIVLVTRKGDKNVVIMSLEKYNQLIKDEKTPLK